jgi:hypothetical protein
MNDRRTAVVKRLRYLWTWELFDSFFLPAVAIFLARLQQKPLGFFAIYGKALVTWILWQGVAYWWLKLRAVKTGAEIPSRALRTFDFLQRVNWALIGLLPIVLIGKGLTGSLFSSALDLTVGLGFYGLALLEQINYYHYQLMYDCPADWRYLRTHYRLKRSKLHRDLERLKCDRA